MLFRSYNYLIYIVIRSKGTISGIFSKVFLLILQIIRKSEGKSFYKSVLLNFMEKKLLLSQMLTLHIYELKNKRCKYIYKHMKYLKINN